MKKTITLSSKRTKRNSTAKNRSKVLVQAVRAYMLDQSSASGHQQVKRDATNSQAGSVDTWQLQDAKAKFSTLVQRALDGRLQVVTRHGKDAVFILSCDSVLEAIEPRANLLDFFRSSPLVGIDLNLDRQQGSLREVEL